MTWFAHTNTPIGWTKSEDIKVIAVTIGILTLLWLSLLLITKLSHGRMGRKKEM